MISERSKSWKKCMGFVLGFFVRTERSKTVVIMGWQEVNLIIGQFFDRVGEFVDSTLNLRSVNGHFDGDQDLTVTGHLLSMSFANRFYESFRKFKTSARSTALPK